MEERHIPWHKNDRLFFDELEAGRRAERHVAHMCLEAGLWVQLPPKSVRSNIEQASEYADEADVWVVRSAPAKVEVKSRRVSFTSPRDIPEENIPFFLTTRDSWLVAQTKPVAFVIVSTVTGVPVVVSQKSFANWTMRTCFDRVRKIEETFLCAGREDIHPFEVFVRAMRKREYAA